MHLMLNKFPTLLILILFSAKSSLMGGNSSLGVPGGHGRSRTPSPFRSLYTQERYAANERKKGTKTPPQSPSSTSASFAENLAKLADPHHGQEQLFLFSPIALTNSKNKLLVIHFSESEFSYPDSISTPDPQVLLTYQVTCYWVTVPDKFQASLDLKKITLETLKNLLEETSNPLSKKISEPEHLINLNDFKKIGNEEEEYFFVPILTFTGNNNAQLTLGYRFENGAKNLPSVQKIIPNAGNMMGQIGFLFEVKGEENSIFKRPGNAIFVEKTVLEKLSSKSGDFKKSMFSKIKNIPRIMEEGSVVDVSKHLD